MEHEKVKHDLETLSHKHEALLQSKSQWLTNLNTQANTNNDKDLDKLVKTKLQATEEYYKRELDETRQVLQQEIAKLRQDQQLFQPSARMMPYSTPISQTLPILEEKEYQIQQLTAQLIESEKRLRQVEKHKLQNNNLETLQRHYEQALLAKTKQVQEFKQALDAIMQNLGDMKQQQQLSSSTKLRTSVTFTPTHKKM